MKKQLSDRATFARSNRPGTTPLYYPVILHCDGYRELLSRDPLPDAATARKYAQIEINRRYDRYLKEDPVQKWTKTAAQESAAAKAATDPADKARHEARAKYARAAARMFNQLQRKPQMKTK